MKTPARVVDALQFALVLAVLLAAVSAPDWLPPLLDRIGAAACARTDPRPSSEGGPVP